MIFAKSLLQMDGLGQVLIIHGFSGFIGSEFQVVEILVHGHYRGLFWKGKWVRWEANLSHYKENSEQVNAMNGEISQKQMS